MARRKKGDPVSGWICLDKPYDLTSTSAVGRVRRLFNAQKAGHAGTLDPMATGVLIVGIERATKLLGLLSLTTKSYAATIRLGVATDTDDAQGQVVRRVAADRVRDGEIAAEIEKLTGGIEQVHRDDADRAGAD